MRPTFGREYIENELRRLGTAVEVPLTAYLIGGGALALRDLKAATKDVDLVVADGESYHRFWSVLADAGYEEVQALGEAYRELGASCCAENDDGCRFDVFNRQVADRLVLTDGMRRRSEPYLDAGSLSVRLVANEDIFAFKMVAGRDDDVEDMSVLVQAGLDFDTIEAAIDEQIEQLGDDLFVTYANEALLELEEEYGVQTPIHDRVQALTDRYYRGLEVLYRLDRPKRVDELATELELDPDVVADRIDYLERFDRVSDEGDDRYTRSV